MAADIPIVEPEIVRAGETLTWSKSYSDYSAADGYSLVYYLTGPSSITITAATYLTTDYLVTEASAVTTLWTPGIYSWESYAELSGEKYFLESGYLTIKSTSGKSHAKTMLDAIEAILEGRATNKDLDVVSKSLGGSSLSRDPRELMKWRAQYRAEYLSEVSRESQLEGKASGNKIRVKFRSA